MHLSETAEEYGNRMAQQALQRQGGTSAPSIWETISTNIKDIVTPLATARQSYDLYKINRDRLKAGLDPLDSSALAPRLTHDFDSSALRRNAPLLIGVGALILFLILRK